MDYNWLERLLQQPSPNEDALHGMECLVTVQAMQTATTMEGAMSLLYHDIDWPDNLNVGCAVLATYMEYRGPTLTVSAKWMHEIHERCVLQRIRHQHLHLRRQKVLEQWRGRRNH